MPVPTPVRRRLVAVLALSLVVIGFGVPLTLSPSARQGRTESCAKPATSLRIGNSVACVHADEAPPGVDVSQRPSTAELRSRRGAGPASYRAAADLGVPTPTEVASTGSGPSVPCDGDGSAGYRIQAMYVVEAGRTNRYASLLSTFRVWATGVDDVVNRSAALTGGVRHLRYVTDPGAGGTCVADVLNVTVPAGATASFGTTVAAIQALGYTSPTRKYLMWTDATALCGVASLYTSDGPTQANPNNGSYAQYARIDSGCWGLGDGSRQHSVEAHELMHTLGAVQNTAPHSTKVGHCWDESDAMCYADGGAYAMKQVCAADKEYFFDCNNDDYFSTYPQTGNYLATHWNAADSRFLIGGGDGSGGGQLGSPSVLGATVSVNNPAVPGLATQVSVAPQLPAGRTVRSVAWRSARSDCTFATPAEVQSTVTCSATSATATTVSVTLVDSSGATRTVTSPLTFSSGSARPVQVRISAADQTTSTASVCTGAAFPVTATVVDVASGSPVKGLSVAFKKQATGLLSAVGTVLSTLLGESSLTQTITAATGYSASTTAGTVYAAGTSPTVNAVPSTCSVTLTGSKDKGSTYYGDPVVVSGRVTRSVGTKTLGVAGLGLPVKLATVVSGVARSTSVGTATTGADGTYAVTVRPTSSGTLSVEVPGSTSYAARSTDLGSVAVSDADTLLTASVDRDDVGYGTVINASGVLQRAAGSAVTALAGSTVSVEVTPDGKAPVKVASGRVGANGAYTVPVPLKYTGELAVVYAGAAGQPARTVVVGPVTAGTWTTRLSSAASSMSIGAGSSVTISGTLTKTYAGSTLPAPGLRISLFFTPSGTITRSLLASPTTTSAGTFSARVVPKTSGTFAALLAAIPGYTEASSAPFGITVN